MLTVRLGFRFRRALWRVDKHHFGVKDLPTSSWTICTIRALAARRIQRNPGVARGKGGHIRGSVPS